MQIHMYTCICIYTQQQTYIQYTQITCITHKPHMCVCIYTHRDINKLKTDRSDCGVQEPWDIDQDTKPTNTQYRRYGDLKLKI